MKACVQSCTRRRDDKFLIVAGIWSGQAQLTGISDVEIAPGRDAVFRDGKARPA